MIKFILLLVLSLAAAHLGMATLANELHKSKKITSSEYEYYTSYEYILDKITSFFKHE
jgi:hypothetical protein